MKQMVLAMGLADEPTLDNFVTGVGNRLALAAVRAQTTTQGEWYLYLYGAAGTGCSHLLKAAASEVNRLNRNQAVYIDLSQAVHQPPAEVLDQLDEKHLICLDHLQAVSGNAEWQEALFHFYNRCRDGNGAKLLVAGNATPQRLGIELADLESRLSWGIVIQLHQLDDDEKLQALKLRAVERGLQISDEIGQFIIARAPRYIPELLAILDQLDRASLTEKRKITVPFVKVVMNW